MPIDRSVAQTAALMLFHELNRGSCKTYFLGCESARQAALIDPLRERVDRYLAFLAYHGCRCVCRAGVRSATAAALLTGLGFEHVWNMKGGMLDWNEAGLPVER